MTSLILASGLSILFITNITGKFLFSAFCSTNLVCGRGPSLESTSNRTPSTRFKLLSTSPPKSACPGVSTILIFISLYKIAVFFAAIVIPRSFSRSIESITLSVTVSCSPKVPLCFNSPSTRVVLPWST